MDSNNSRGNVLTGITTESKEETALHNLNPFQSVIFVAKRELMGYQHMQK